MPIRRAYRFEEGGLAGFVVCACVRETVQKARTNSGIALMEIPESFIETQ